MERWRLKARRKALGFSQTSLAHCIGCDRNTVNRWERGVNDVAPHHREPLRGCLSTDTSPLTAIDLEALLNGDPEPQLVAGYNTVLITLEQTATSLRIWAPLLMPGLLQTREYAQAILRDDELVAARLDRQAALTRDQPLELTAVIDESVLHRPIGGHDVLVAQLEHLLKMAQLRNINIRILPFDSPEQPMFFGEVWVFGFPGIPLGMAYMDHGNVPAVIAAQREVEEHADRFARLVELSTSNLDRVKREIVQHDR